MRKANFSQGRDPLGMVLSSQGDFREHVFCLELGHVCGAHAKALPQSQPTNKTAWDIAREAYEKVSHVQSTLPVVPVTPKGTAPMGNKLARS